MSSWTMDLDDLESKAKNSGAKVLLLSHMRGKVGLETTEKPETCLGVLVCWQGKHSLYMSEAEHESFLLYQQVNG